MVVRNTGLYGRLERIDLDLCLGLNLCTIGETKNTEPGVGG